MSFCFNFDLPALTTNPDGDDGYKVQKEKIETAAKSVSNITSQTMCLRLSTQSCQVVLYGLQQTDGKDLVNI